MLKDLKMTTNDYNNGMTIFYCSFLFAELPSQMISKRLGPDRWIPVQMVSWSLVASCQAFLNGRTSFFICRFLLGLIEGGFIPDAILYLSYYYKSSELPQRLSFFWVAYQGTQIVAAFLAYGILRMRGINGLPGWAWLFALEGTLTGLIGIFAWFYLPSSPYTTPSWFRGKKGWFDEREEKIIANRIIRDDPSKGDMHNREALSLGMLKECLLDWHMWPTYLIGLSWTIPNVSSALGDFFETFANQLHRHLQQTTSRSTSDRSASERSRQTCSPSLPMFCSLFNFCSGRGSPSASTSASSSDSSANCGHFRYSSLSSQSQKAHLTGPDTS
jgi:MFS family permease